MEILRQQLKVYAEDFRMETDERKKLHNENLALKKKMSQVSESQEHLKNQVSYKSIHFQKFVYEIRIFDYNFTNTSSKAFNWQWWY